jgi:hypothetical protein
VVDTNLPACNEFVSSLNTALSLARDSLHSAQARIKKNADTHRRELNIKVGYQVLLSSKNIRLRTAGTKKLLPKFLGPFTVLQKIGKQAYKLDLSTDMPKVHPVFHISLLRPFKPGSNQPPPPVPVLIEGEPEYEVERILNHRNRKFSNKSKHTKREYLVKWSGYGHEYNSWQAQADCGNSEDLIQQYLASLKPK